MDDIKLDGKTVLVRLDLNSPMKNGKIVSDNRLRSYIHSLKELDGSKTVILAHQSRPGRDDFSTMEPHARKLSELLGKEVEYIDDIFGHSALQAIDRLKIGEILLLENVRFYSEEMLKRSAEKHARSHMVKNLSPHVDLFMNDAFSVAHRSHLSVVGFSPALPSIAGRTMEKEINALEKVLKGSKKPCLFVIGGRKVKDSIKIIKNVLSKKIADSVLLTGLVASVFLASKVDIGGPNIDFIRSQGYLDQIDPAKKLLNRFEKIKLPMDVALKKNGKRVESSIFDEISYPIYDIGSETIASFLREIGDAKTVVMKGPAGVFEEEEFSLGTFELLKAISKADFSVVGGGDTGAAVDSVDTRFSHVSTGGGACMAYLSGELLPGIEALKNEV